MSHRSRISRASLAGLGLLLFLPQTAPAKPPDLPLGLKVLCARPLLGKAAPDLWPEMWQPDAPSAPNSSCPLASVEATDDLSLEMLPISY
jgi:hypothetical protein